MSNQTDLITTDQRKDLSAPSVGQMLSAIVEKGVTQDNVAAIKELAELHWKMQEREAQKDFASAFVALQRDMPVIVASSVIPNRGKYERFEDIMKVVGPLLVKHGFSISFTNESKDNRITETCFLSHISGHSRTTSFTVRVGGKADSETQADCKAATTAKRNALINCLNLTIRQDALLDEDNDPRLEGSEITSEQAFELERRVHETNSDVDAFLKVANSKDFASILSGKYNMLDGLLRRKESKGK